MRISLVCTAKNEEDNIAQLIESMLGQSLRPDEIVINDNNSTDATAAIVQHYHNLGHPVRLVTGGHNIPSGRNNAIYHATGGMLLRAPMRGSSSIAIGWHASPSPCVMMVLMSWRDFFIRCHAV